MISFLKLIPVLPELSALNFGDSLQESINNAIPENNINFLILWNNNGFICNYVCLE